jgi:hypothetical protein
MLLLRDRSKEWYMNVGNVKGKILDQAVLNASDLSTGTLVSDC